MWLSILLANGAFFEVREEIVDHFIKFVEERIVLNSVSVDDLRELSVTDKLAESLEEEFVLVWSVGEIEDEVKSDNLRKNEIK